MARRKEGEAVKPPVSAFPFPHFILNLKIVITIKYKSVHTCTYSGLHKLRTLYIKISDIFKSKLSGSL